MTMGIYQINGPNGCIYRGSAVNFERRIRQHIRLLERKEHYSSYMQRHSNKYGIDAFTFGLVVDTESVLYLVEIQRAFCRKHNLNVSVFNHMLQGKVEFCGKFKRVAF